MKRPLFLLFFVIVPLQTLAQTVPAQVSTFMGKIYLEILNPLITVAFAAAILYLSYCVFQYTLNSDKYDRKQLQNSLIYSVIGVFIMSTVFAIMKFVARSLTGDDSIVTQNV